MEKIYMVHLPLNRKKWQHFRMLQAVCLKHSREKKLHIKKMIKNYKKMTSAENETMCYW